MPQFAAFQPQYTCLVVLLAFVCALGGGISPASAVKDRLQWGLERAAKVASYPSHGSIYVQIDFDRRNVRIRDAVRFGRQAKSAQVRVYKGEQAAALAEERVEIAEGVSREVRLAVPQLTNEVGPYRVVVDFDHPEEPRQVVIDLARERFAWEGNRLGEEDTVPPPFTPVEVDGDRVRIIEREVRLNGYGLPAEIVAAEESLLAGPISLRYRLGGGSTEEVVGEGTLSSIDRRPTQATFEAAGGDSVVTYAVRSEVAYDGLLKVDMTLKPGATTQAIEKLWIDIPLVESAAPLMHAWVDGPRINKSGRVPGGEGVVWTSADARRYGRWQNTFVPYIWLGAERAGLAWFAENDRGWGTAKGGDRTPTQELIRDGQALTLRVYLINTPTTLDEPRRLTFGMQTSPVKPMPENWRSQTLAIAGGSGPVVCWGGLHCASLEPYNGDWRVIDEVMLPAINEDRFDRERLAELVAELDPPPVLGVHSWEEHVARFAQRYQGFGDRPYLTYTSENRASTVSAEWRVFQDEWSLGNFSSRDWPDESIFRGGSEVNPSVDVNTSESFIDYTVYIQNEWLKRGIGIYWDNDRPRLSHNTRLTAAYETESGVQPAVPIWSQRDLHERVYRLLMKHRETYGDHLHWSGHITNVNALPIHGFLTVALDNEWSRAEKFEPDYLRAQSLGFQLGAFSYCLNPVYGKLNPVAATLSDADQQRAYWGMRMVHEIARSGYFGGIATEQGDRRCAELERLVRDYGYGDPELKVTHYWADHPPIHVSNDEVKWILLDHPQRTHQLLILASWIEEPTTVRLQGNDTPILTNAESGEPVDASAIGLATLGVKVLEVAR